MTAARLDVELVHRGLARSRTQARELVTGGAVLVDGRAVTKPALPVGPDTDIALSREPDRWVGRAAYKLLHALDTWPVEVPGRRCLDVGASTGGFTDCLLQRGALHVYAVDVGRGQLLPRLRTDPRVVVRDGVNARYLGPAVVPEPVDLATVDVSFISLEKILPAIVGCLAAEALGCEVGAIANSLVFAIPASEEGGEDEPLLLLTSGAHRVDTAKVAATLGVPALKRAKPDFVRRHTGQVIGGVSPIAHPAPVRTFLDPTLQQYDEIWAAAGHPAAVFSTTYTELKQMTGAEDIDVN